MRATIVPKGMRIIHAHNTHTCMRVVLRILHAYKVYAYENVHTRVLKRRLHTRAINVYVRVY